MISLPKCLVSRYLIVKTSNQSLNFLGLSFPIWETKAIGLDHFCPILCPLVTRDYLNLIGLFPSCTSPIPSAQWPCVDSGFYIRPRGGGRRPSWQEVCGNTGRWRGLHCTARGADRAALPQLSYLSVLVGSLLVSITFFLTTALHRTIA